MPGDKGAEQLGRGDAHRMAGLLQAKPQSYIGLYISARTVRENGDMHTFTLPG
jgi:hypothetical protein